jgi:hypothetical protein
VRTDDDFRHNGNVVLDALFGAKIHRLPLASFLMVMPPNGSKNSGMKVKNPS